MTDIEKESIEQLKSWREYIIKHKETVNKANDIEFYLRTALNLIQKQDTEINSLKETIKKQEKSREHLKKQFKGEINKLNKRISDLEFALIDMVYQFADESENQINTMGLSALETAFCELDFDNPIDKDIVIKKFEELYKKYINNK